MTGTEPSAAKLGPATAYMAIAVGVILIGPGLQAVHH